MKLSEPQRKGLLYYRRAGLPLEQKMVELKTGPRINEPDPRVPWKLVELGLLEQGSGRQRWKLTAEGAKLAEELRAPVGALTAEERKAILALKELAKTWPKTLTVLVTSSSERAAIIKTPKPGDDTFDDLSAAEILEMIYIPVGHCS